MKRLLKSLALVGLSYAALLNTLSCSSPELDGLRYSCERDADCPDDSRCVSEGLSMVCSGEVSTEPIKIGMSAPLQGPSQGLGIEMRRGILAMFEKVNAEGGIEGRPLELVSLNDNYDPDMAEDNMTRLLDIQRQVKNMDQPDERGDDSVFALLGNVGTPTMLRTAPIATKNEVIFFAPFTGSQAYLRDDTNSPFIYNYRAGYYEELEAMVDYIATYRQPRVISNPPAESYRNLIAFTQRDSYGDAGYNGLVNAYNKLSPLPQPDSTKPNPSIARVYYDRENVSSVNPAIDETKTLLTNILEDSSELEPVAILMVDTYLPGNKYIRAVKDWINEEEDRTARLDVLFMHVSFVGSNSLAAALSSAPESFTDIVTGKKTTYAEGILVTQVVPNYRSQAAGVVDYRRDLSEFDGGTFSFTSLEGYIGARLFVEALQLAGRELSTQSLREVLNKDVRNIDIGIGTLLNFSATDHQASDTVWGSVIQADGSFDVPFTWTSAEGINAN